MRRTDLTSTLINKHTCSLPVAGQVRGDISAIIYKYPHAAVDITSDAFH